MDPANLINPAAMLGLALLLAAGALVYFAALTLFTLARLRKPHRRTYAYAVARNIPGEPAELDPPPRHHDHWTLTHTPAHRPSELDIWDIAGDDPQGPTLVLTHGWGASRIDMLARFQALRPRIARALLWDMPGHGDTPGPCTLGVREPAILADLARLAIQPITTDESVRDGDPAHPSPRLVLYGYSLGAEVTLKALRLLDDATRAALAGVILEAPYRRGVTPAKAVLAASQFPWRINLPAALALGSLLDRTAPAERWHDLARLAEDATTTATAAGTPALPVLVLHGLDDTISPPADGRAIAEAARGTLAEIPGAGHKDLFDRDAPAETRPEIDAALAEFFAAVSASAAGASTAGTSADAAINPASASRPASSARA